VICWGGGGLWQFPDSFCEGGRDAIACLISLSKAENMESM